MIDEKKLTDIAYDYGDWIEGEAWKKIEKEFGVEIWTLIEQKVDLRIDSFIKTELLNRDRTIYAHTTAFLLVAVALTVAICFFFWG